MNAGRKSNPKKGAGLPKPIAAKVPIIMLIPPVNGPRSIPYRGARMSDKWKVAPVPIMGTVGMILSAAYSAAKIAIMAIVFVLRLRLRGLLISPSSC
jgi:hypothetical protein